jgi:hypothetical protein
MTHKQGTMDRKESVVVPVLYVAFELANSTWKLACSNGSKVRHVTVPAADLDQVQGAILGAKRHFGLGDKVHTVSCYEAGRDGFWLHRYLHSCRIDNVVVDSASLEVNRRLRRAKTDRVDAAKLLSMLIRYHGGEKHLWKVVRVPSREDEDARHLHRELEALKRERTRYRNRIHGILIQQGLRINNPSKKKFVQELELLRTWDGRKLPAEMKVRMVRVYERLRLVEDQHPGKRENTAAQGRKRQDGASGPTPETPRDRPGEFLDLCYGVFWLAPVSELTGSGRPGGPDTYPLRQRHQAARTRDQQGRQSASAHFGYRDRLGLAAVSTSKHVQPMVPGTICRWR